MRFFLIYIFFLLLPAASHANSETEFVGKNPIILIARISVKPGLVEEYLEIAEEVDNETQKLEPGMIFHNFDSDLDNELAFTWSEIYLNSEALIFHLNAAHALDYVKKHGQLANSFEIEIYGNLSLEAIRSVKNLGLPFKHFKTTRVGYVRGEYFKNLN